jgi:predicted ArsR family transcriptional regulator
LFFVVANIGYHQSMDQYLQAQLLAILKASPSGLQMEALAEKLGLTRHTVAKYLEVLRAEGAVHYQKVGRSKLWKDIPTTTQIRLLTVNDLDDILRIEERIEKDHGSEDPERLNHLRETATYHLQHGDPLMNLGAEIEGRLVGFVLAETKRGG